jgi:hypothetical protein
MTSTTSALLRVYDPSECDDQGVPLDWERCQQCGGDGFTVEADPADESGETPEQVPCDRCETRGSLKAVVLAHFMARQRPDETCSGDPDQGTCTCDTLRCEDCGHPMGDGTWEGSEWGPRSGLSPAVGSEAWAFEHLRRGNEPPREIVGSATGTHYSPCDEECRHEGPTRFRHPAGDFAFTYAEHPVNMRLAAESGGVVEAPWRGVDVRTLGWPHDLRPERIALLCLRCLAARE